MKSSFLSSPVLTVCLIVVLGYLSVNAVWIAVSGGQMGEAYEDLERSVSRLREQRGVLSQELAWVKTEQFAEQEARDKLFLARSDEKVVVYPEGSYQVLAERVESEREQEEVGVEGVERVGYLGEWMKVFGFLRE